MKLIFKYMKPFVFMALAAVALLFCQIDEFFRLDDPQFL